MSPSQVDPRETEPPASRKGAGTGAAVAGTSGRGPVTDGLVFGMSGAPFWARWLIVAIGACAIQALDVGSTLGVERAAGLHTPLWQVLVNGYSSVAIIILIYPPLRALCMAAHPWDRRPWRMAALHVAGFAGFYAAHLVGMFLIRAAVFIAVLGHYETDVRTGALELLPRDLLTYAVIVALVWFILRLEARSLAPPQRAGAPATFDIRDGARLIRVPVEDITAVRAAGNYVEFLLTDGRRPLMRATMAAAEASLAPHGFVRTHRAWIINRAAITGLAPAGSGDLTVSLTGGLEAPVSRRYRRAAEPLSRG